MAVRSRLARVLRGVVRRQVTQYGSLVVRIYTRTFYSHRYKYAECYQTKVHLPTPIVFRHYSGSSEMVKLLMAATFEVIGPHLTLEQWNTLQWERLCALLLSSIAWDTEEEEEGCECLTLSLQDYTITTKIGDVSTCALVYHAHNRRTGREVALKAMFNWFTDSPRAMLREEVFGAELALTRLPRHCNIIRITGHFVGDNLPLTDEVTGEFPAVFHPDWSYDRTLFIEMPLFDRSLSSLLSSSSSSLSLPQILLILFQILSGLHHINSHGIVHRDLKLENILVREMPCGTLHAVITDFGMCHEGLVVEGGWPHGRPWGNPVTPPEVILSEDWVDYTKSDVWSVGTLIYELLGLECPFSSLKLSPKTYRTSDLPHIEDSWLSGLATSFLAREPGERPTAGAAAVATGARLWVPAVTQPTDLAKPDIEGAVMELALRTWAHATRPSFETVLLAQFLEMAGVSATADSSALFGAVS